MSNEQQLKEEAAMHLHNKYKLAEAQLDRLSKKDLLGEEIKNMPSNKLLNYKKAAMAFANTERAFQLMTEDQYASSFSRNVKPEVFLKAVFLGVANSHRGDIFTEIPVNSTDDAFFYIQATYEQKKRGAEAGQKTYESAVPYYAGQEFLDAAGVGNGSTKEFTKKIPYAPIVPWTVKITVNDNIVASDNGSGTLSGAALNSSSTIDYEDGTVKIVFEDAPKSGAAIKVSYQWNSELRDNYENYGTLGLSLEKYRFDCKPHPLGYRISDMMDIMFSTTGLGSAMDYLTLAVAQEHARARDYRAIQLAKRVAAGNVASTFDADFAKVGEISYKNHAQLLTNAIQGVGHLIHEELKRGGVNTIVAGTEATNYASLHDTWKATGNDAQGLYHSGTLNGMQVYTCPSNNGELIKPNQMMLIYKNPVEQMDVSLLFGNLSEIDSKLRFPNFITEGNTATIEDVKIVNGKFIRMLNIENLRSNVITH